MLTFFNFYSLGKPKYYKLYYYIITIEHIKSITMDSSRVSLWSSGQRHVCNHSFMLVFHPFTEGHVD